MMLALRCRLGVFRGRSTGKLLPQMTHTYPKFDTVALICFWLSLLVCLFMTFLANLQLDTFATRWRHGQQLLGALKGSFRLV